MKRRFTSNYPTRYEAFKNEGILFEALNKKETCGFEFAIYYKSAGKFNYISAEIESYQNKHLQLTYEERGIFGNKMIRKSFSYYEFENAVKEIEKNLENNKYLN